MTILVTPLACDESGILISMHVSLTPELEHQIRLKIECDGIHQGLKDELGVGIEQLRRGEGVPVTDGNDFMAKARGKQ